MLELFSDVQTALQRYAIRQQDDRQTTFNYLDGDGLNVVFQIGFAESYGRGRIFIGVNVDYDNGAMAQQALLLNSEISVGSLAAWRGMILLKHVMTLGRCDEAELHTVIRTLALTAELVRQRLRKPAAIVHIGYAD